MTYKIDKVSEYTYEINSGLKPCPFCGSSNVYASAHIARAWEESTINDHTQYEAFAKCEHCGARKVNFASERMAQHLAVGNGFGDGRSLDNRLSALVSNIADRWNMRGGVSEE